MPTPGMVQIDPVQRQTSATADVFDARQTALQAKQDVNLLIEKLKSELQSSKHESLQILSSFPIPIKKGHEWEMRETYRKAACDANDLLRKEGAPIAIWLEDVGDKFHIVTGRYEERTPKVMQIEEKMPQVVQSEEGGKAVPAVTPIFDLTETDRNELCVTNEVLAGMKPNQLTDGQWKVLNKIMDKTAEHIYGKNFDKLSQGRKINVLRHIFSPHTDEGKELGFTYSGSAELKIAAETLSSLKGDCDDFSFLYIACANRLDGEGRLHVKDIKLAVVDYYDPKNNEIGAHANVFPVVLNKVGGKRAKIFLVDLTFNTSTTPLGHKENEIDAKNDKFRDKFLGHMNESREEKKIEVMELRLYDGFTGLLAYYYTNNGATLAKEAKDIGKNSEKQIDALMKLDEYDKVVAIYQDIDNKFEDAKKALNGAIEIGKESGCNYGDALVRMGILYYGQGSNLINWSTPLSASGKSEDGTKKTAKGIELHSDCYAYFKEALELPDVSSFVLNEGAKVLRESLNSEGYLIAEQMVVKAIKAAPFKPELYETLLSIMNKEGKTSEALKLLQEYIKAPGLPPEVKKMIDGLITEAAGVPTEH
ncbi:MAG: hypothetical protein WCY41_00525 [Candidatus Micrarchaeia archaeon]